MTDAAFFPGFSRRTFEIDGLLFNSVIGGSGPPVVLLHGAPQCHLIWRHLAPIRAERFTVLAPDLRGYGESDKPATSDYSKRRMAADVVEMTRQLGFDRFFLAGHDRGARVARRLAKDHPALVQKLALIDIVPTAHVYANMTRQVAVNFWNWVFWILPFPVPETLMGPQSSTLISRMAQRIGAEKDVAEAYVRMNGTAEAFHAMCEDYRAGAGEGTGARF